MSVIINNPAMSLGKEKGLCLIYDGSIALVTT